MHHAPTTPATASPHTPWVLRIIVVGVLVAHALLLHSIGNVLGSGHLSQTTASTQSFSTRTITLPDPPPTTTAQATPLTSKSQPPVQKSVPQAPRPDTTTDYALHAGNKVTGNAALPPLSDTILTDTIAPATAASTATSSTTQAPPEPTPATLLPKGLKPVTAPTRYIFPAPARLKYDIKGEVKGFAYFANGSLLWQHNGGNYDAQLEISHFLLGSRTQTSSGQLTTHGLEPLRFADKARSEVAAQFDHVQSLVTFSADAARTALQAGAQDQLSVFFQLSALLAGEPQRYKQGDKIPFQAVGARSSEQWIFVVSNLETLTLPGGTVQAIKLVRHPPNQGAPQVDVWLAPRLDYLPVRIRLTQGDGDFVEQQWRASQKP